MSGILYDERNRPYTELPGQPGRRSYISPVAMGTGARPTDGGGIFRTDYGWDQNKGEWTRGVDWGNIATLAVPAIATAGIAPAFMGGGGAASGGGGTAAASAAPAAATGGSGVAAGTGGMSFGKLLGLGAMGTGFDLLGSLLGGGGGEDRESFAGKRGSNGVSVDPTEVYSQGLGLLKDAAPQMASKFKTPTRMRTMVPSTPGLSGMDARLRDPNSAPGTSDMDMEQLKSILKILGI